MSLRWQSRPSQLDFQFTDRLFRIFIQVNVIRDKMILSCLVLPLFVQKNVRVQETGLDSKEKMYQYRRAIAVHIMLIGFQHKLQKWIFRQLPREKKMYKNVSHHAFMPAPHFFTWIYCRKANENMYEYDLEATQNIWMFVELGTSFFFLVFTRMLLQKIKHLILFQGHLFSCLSSGMFEVLIWVFVCVCGLIFAFVFIFGCGR